MNKLIAAHTTAAQIFPGYINASREDDGAVVITARGDPKTVDSIYICGHAHDMHKPGRCTPGDEHCNNYCNLAPEKGAMQDSPLPCQQTYCGETVTIRLSANEWTELLAALVAAA